MEIYRPFSEKTRKAAEKFLSKFSLTLENLTEQQKKSLMNYIKRKRFLKWDVPITALCIISILALSIYYYPKFLSSAGGLIPKFVKVNNNGNQSYVELDKDTRENLKSDIVLSAKAGFYLGLWFSSYIFISISIIIAELIDLRNQKKIFHAFLPSIKTAVPDNQKIN
jgi:hypothetical protein